MTLNNIRKECITWCKDDINNEGSEVLAFALYKLIWFNVFAMWENRFSLNAISDTRVPFVSGSINKSLSNRFEATSENNKWETINPIRKVLIRVGSVKLVSKESTQTPVTKGINNNHENKINKATNETL